MNNITHSSSEDNTNITVQDQMSCASVIAADAQKPGSSWKERNTRKYNKRKTHRAGAKTAEATGNSSDEAKKESDSTGSNVQRSPLNSSSASTPSKSHDSKQASAGDSPAQLEEVSAAVPSGSSQGAREQSPQNPPNTDAT